MIVLAGDFNGACVSNLCNTFQLNKINQGATRGKNCLDYIITNAPRCYTVENWPPLAKSDHSVVLALPNAAKYNSLKPVTKTIKVRSGKIRDTVHQIRNYDWSTVINSLASNTQSATNEFYDAILSAENYNQPIKTLNDLTQKRPTMDDI